MSIDESKGAKENEVIAGQEAENIQIPTLINNYGEFIGYVLDIAEKTNDKPLLIYLKTDIVRMLKLRVVKKVEENDIVESQRLLSVISDIEKEISELMSSLKK
jgi:hypothetical protein